MLMTIKRFNSKARVLVLCFIILVAVSGQARANISTTESTIEEPAGGPSSVLVQGNPQQRVLKQIELDPAQPIRVLGAGIENSFTHDVIQLTCVSKNYLDIHERFQACDVLAFIYRQFSGKNYLSVLPVSIPQNENLKKWFRKNFKEFIHYYPRNSKNFRQKQGKVMGVGFGLGGGLMVSSAVLLTNGSISKAGVKAGAILFPLGFAVGLSTIIGGGISDSVESKHFLSFNHTKEEFFNRSKDSWQFRSKSIRDPDLFSNISEGLLQSAIVVDQELLKSNTKSATNE
jgi:hypothetical protein